MNRTLEHLALRKKRLQERSALCRLSIRHERDTMRDTLSWARAAVKALPGRSTVFGLALHGLADRRLARWLSLAARVALLARLAGIAASLLRKPL